MDVLIVEDDGLIALGLKATVEDAGFRVTGVAADAAGALASAARDRPHVALLDLNLLDGPTGGPVALALFASHGVRPIFVTGNPELIPAEARAICLAVLEKPARPAAIAAALRAAMQETAH